MISVIVAYDENRCIGNSSSNNIPWYIPSDLIHFKQVTMGATVIMGRKTWESLDRKALPDRYNIVITRNADLYNKEYSDIDFVSSINIVKNIKNSNIFVIGGAEIYKEFLVANLVDRIYITKVNAIYDGDIYFPIIPQKNAPIGLTMKSTLKLAIPIKASCEFLGKKSRVI